MKAFFEKYGIWIALGFIILWLVKIHRTMTMQNGVILSLAKKVGLEIASGNKNPSSKEQGEDEEFKDADIVEDEAEDEAEEEQEEEKKELTEDEINQLVEDMQAISAKIKSKEKISKEDEDYYRMFFNDMHPDLKLEPLTDSKNTGATIIPLHPKQEAPKAQVAENKPSVNESQTHTNSDKTNNSEEKIKAPAQQETNTLLTGNSNTEIPNIKKFTAQEKKDLIIGFFSEGKPLYQKEIAEKLATATNTKLNPGNTNGLVAELVADKHLNEHPIKINGKTYYGLPTWFDKKKLTKEYLKKIK